MVKKLLEFFTKKNCKTSNLEVLQEKGDEIYVKWKVYGDSFDSYIDKKKYCYLKISYSSQS